MSNETALELKRVLPASRERVFAAWTRTDLIKKWFAPGNMQTPVAEIDLRVGGNYRIVMQNADGETHSPSGAYEEIIPDEKLVFTWKWQDSDLVTRVTIILTELGAERTELILRHEGFPAEEIRDRHDEGWTGCLANLEAVL